MKKEAGNGGEEKPDDKKPEQKPEEKKPEAKTLPGIAMIKALKVLLDEHSPMQENAAIANACKKTVGIWRDASGKAYPGEDFGWPKDEGGEGDDEGDDGGKKKPEEGEGKKPEDEDNKDKKSAELDFTLVLEELKKVKKSADATEEQLFRLTGR